MLMVYADDTVQDDSGDGDIGDILPVVVILGALIAGLVLAAPGIASGVIKAKYHIIAPP